MGNHSELGNRKAASFSLGELDNLAAPSSSSTTVDLVVPSSSSAAVNPDTPSSSAIAAITHLASSSAWRADFTELGMREYWALALASALQCLDSSRKGICSYQADLQVNACLFVLDSLTCLMEAS